ncbi:MAG: phage tail protein [Desulfobacteraceae bacterium]|nr:phage tail protein [Desulfobacteraceae bacterium]
MEGSPMTDPFIGEVKMVAFNFPPEYWAFCNGQEMQINQNQALYSLIGTYYGGDGISNFQLPDLRGRTPLGFGASLYFGTPYTLGWKSGLPSYAMHAQDLPGHTHQVNAKCDPSSTVDPTPPYADENTTGCHIPASMPLADAAPFSSDTTTTIELAPTAV